MPLIHTWARHICQLFIAEEEKKKISLKSGLEGVGTYSNCPNLIENGTLYLARPKEKLQQ
jgi:hypothetical protein